MPIYAGKPSFLPSFQYKVEFIPGLTGNKEIDSNIGFSSITGINSTLSVVEIKEVTNFHKSLVLGSLELGTAVFSKGLLAVRDGYRRVAANRINMTIRRGALIPLKINIYTGQGLFASLEEAYITKFEINGMDAGASGIVISTMEVKYQQVLF